MIKLMFYQMGYEGLFFARMHYAELQQRALNKSLEMNWKLGGNGHGMNGGN
jgi:hypothetical protein